jgi:hypothetical protein
LSICADRRDAEVQIALFKQDTHFVVFVDGRSAEPTQGLRGRAAVTPVFANL